MTLNSGDRAPHERSTLRGPAPLAASPKIARNLGVLALVAIAVAIVISFVSAQRDNARIERLKSDGIPLIAVARDCVGNLGGSGSNASSYTCRASYRAGSTSYLEVVGRMSTFVAPGTKLRVIADPRQLSTIDLASSLSMASVSTRTYLVPSVLSALFVALLAGYLYRRRSRPLPAQGSDPT